MISTKQDSNTTLKFRSDPWTATGYYSHLLPPHKVGKFDEVCKKIRNTPDDSEKMNKLCQKLMAFEKYELHEPKPKR